jgi:hypothetical protein
VWDIGWFGQLNGTEWNSVLRFFQAFNDFFGALFAHVEDFDGAVVVGKRGVGGVEKPLHRAVMTGGDLHRLIFVGVGEQGLQTRVAAGGHFTEVGDTLESDAGVTEFFQHFVFHFAGNDLGVGATAVEDAGGGHGVLGQREWGKGRLGELDRHLVLFFFLCRLGKWRGIFPQIVVNAEVVEPEFFREAVGEMSFGNLFAVGEPLAAAGGH